MIYGGLFAMPPVLAAFVPLNPWTLSYLWLVSLMSKPRDGVAASKSSYVCESALKATVPKSLDLVSSTPCSGPALLLFTGSWLSHLSLKDLIDCLLTIPLKQALLIKPPPWLHQQSQYFGGDLVSIIRLGSLLPEVRSWTIIPWTWYRFDLGFSLQLSSGNRYTSGAISVQYARRCSPSSFGDRELAYSQLQKPADSGASNSYRDHRAWIIGSIDCGRTIICAHCVATQSRLGWLSDCRLAGM